MNLMTAIPNVLSSAATIPARAATLAVAAVDAVVHGARSLLGVPARVEEAVLIERDAMREQQTEPQAETQAETQAEQQAEPDVDLRGPNTLEGLTPNEAVLAVIEQLDDSVSAVAIATALAERGRTEDAATIDSALTMLATQKRITKHGPALYAPAQ